MAQVTLSKAHLAHPDWRDPIEADVFYDRKCRKINQEDFHKLFSNRDYQQIKLDTKEVEGESITVSTIWLGIDHGFDPNKPPVIFETMVFANGAEIDCNRASSEEAILAIHRKMKEKWFKEEQEPQSRFGMMEIE